MVIPGLDTAPTTNPRLLGWVRDVAELTKPDRVVWARDREVRFASRGTGLGR